MLGSVSSAVLHHADRPVLVIPAPAPIADRERWSERARATADVSAPVHNDERDLNVLPTH